MNDFYYNIFQNNQFGPLKGFETQEQVIAKLGEPDLKDKTPFGDVCFYYGDAELAFVNDNDTLGIIGLYYGKHDEPVFAQEFIHDNKLKKYSQIEVLTQYLNEKDFDWFIEAGDNDKTITLRISDGPHIVFHFWDNTFHSIMYRFEK
jgi:hypothetical protein